MQADINPSHLGEVVIAAVRTAVDEDHSGPRFFGHLATEDA